ncbi:MAG: Spo0E family sporulation regulatory protein-aspartic acid phosphatase [Bacillota bacterium]
MELFEGCRARHHRADHQCELLIYVMEEVRRALYAIVESPGGDMQHPAVQQLSRTFDNLMNMYLTRSA